MENTLLSRCTAAVSDAYELTGPFDDWTESCAGAVLEHLAAELLVMHQRDPRLTVFELARILAAEGQSCQPEPLGHPSLTAAERNPSLT